MANQNPLRYSKLPIFQEQIFCILLKGPQFNMILDFKCAHIFKGKQKKNYVYVRLYSFLFYFAMIWKLVKIYLNHMSIWTHTQFSIKDFAPKFIHRFFFVVALVFECWNVAYFEMILCYVHLKCVKDFEA